MANDESDSNSVLTEEEKRTRDDQKIEELVQNIIGDKEEAKKFNQAMSDLRFKLGLLPLERKDYSPKTMIEYIIYNMRWNQKVFSNCSLIELHEFELALSAHILYAKTKENQWMTAYQIEKQQFDRAVAQASKYCEGKTLRERTSEVISRSETLFRRGRTLEIYKLYAEQCENISDVFVQMDNGLKKMIDTRRLDYEHSKKG